MALPFGPYVLPKQAFIDNVTDVVFEFTGPGTLKITWNGSGNSYRIWYRKRAEINWIAVPETVLEEVTIVAAFELGVAYDFKIISLTGGSQETAPDYYGYTIPSGEVAPTDFVVVMEDMTTAKATWTGDPAANYAIIYHPLNAPNDVSVFETTGNEAIIEGLIPCIPYQFEMGKIVNDDYIPFADNPVIVGECV